VFIQTFKCFFPALSRTCKDQIQGFPGLKNPVFQDFSGNVPFKTLVARDQSAYTKLVISLSAIKVKKRKC